MGAGGLPPQGGGRLTTAPAEGGRRPYRSTRRRQQQAQTRELVLAAATALFADRGWSGTGMRDVARQAGVAVETVYSNFGSKTELLLAAIDVGVVGDVEPVPLSDRPEFAALGRSSMAERLAAAARLIAGINQRTSGLRRALGEAAASEPDLGPKLVELESRRRENTRQAAEMVVDRPVDDDELDALWAIMSIDVFHLVTEVRGRSVRSYEEWIAELIPRLLTGETGNEHSRENGS